MFVKFSDHGKADSNMRTTHFSKIHVREMNNIERCSYHVCTVIEIVITVANTCHYFSNADTSKDILVNEFLNT